MDLYTIFDSPEDYPGLFVVRKFKIGAGTVEAGELIWTASTLEAARAPLAQRGLVPIPRSPEDTPSTVETWV